MKSNLYAYTAIPIVKDQYGTIIEGKHRYAMLKAYGIEDSEMIFRTQHIDYNKKDALTEYLLHNNSQRHKQSMRKILVKTLEGLLILCAIGIVGGMCTTLAIGIPVAIIWGNFTLYPILGCITFASLGFGLPILITLGIMGEL